MTVVVFGARGSVGRQVVQGLLDAGETVRATSRQKAEGPDFVMADLDHPETLGPALAGAEKAFLYARPQGIDGFVEAAKAAGVRQVALLSSGAVERGGDDRDPIVYMHRTVENALEKSGLEWTFVRGGMFATNTIGLWGSSIREEGVVRLPYPDAQSAPVHEADLADVAVAALTTAGHGQKAYTLWGPESLSLREQVDRIAAAIGRPVKLEVVSPDAARAEMGRTLPDFAVNAILGNWSEAGDRPAETSAVVPQVLGRPARTFAEWAVDHADDFR